MNYNTGLITVHEIAATLINRTEIGRVTAIPRTNETETDTPKQVMQYKKFAYRPSTRPAVITTSTKNIKYQMAASLSKNWQNSAETIESKI